MKNATLSVLLLLTLGTTWVGMAAAQADEPEGGEEAPSEDSDSADEGATEEAPAEDAAPAEGDATEGDAVDPAEAAPVEGAEGAEAAPAEETAPVEGVEAPVEEAPVVEETPIVEEAVVEEAPVEEVVEEPTEDLATPDTQAEEATEEAAAEPEEEAAAPPPPPPWRNSFFSYNNQVSTNSFWRGAQLSHNPVWQMGFSVIPRWYPGTGGFLRANWGFTIEVTDTDSNALNREPLLNDLLIDYVHPFVLGEGFILMPMARVTVPVSRASLAAQRYLQAAGQLTLIKIIPEAGNLTLAFLGRYGYWFAGSNVVQTDTPQPDICPAPPVTNTGGGMEAPEPGLTTCGQFGTATTGRHIILAGISATMTPIGAFSINLSAFIFNSYGHDLAPAYIDVDTSENPVMIADGSPTHWRNFTYFALSVAYQFLPWLNMSLGVQNSGIVASAYDPSGGLYNPFFTPSTQVFLGATIGLDELLGEIIGGNEEELTPEERQRRQQGLASGPSAGGSF